jgi:hypothetical protein
MGLALPEKTGVKVNASSRDTLAHIDTAPITAVLIAYSLNA